MYGHPSNTYPYCTDKWYKILRVSNSSGKLESLFPEEFKIVLISRIALVGIEKDALFIPGGLHVEAAYYNRDEYMEKLDKFIEKYM